MEMKLGIILDWTNCQIISEAKAVRVLVKMNSGDWLQLQPFPPDLKGLIAAMDVAMAVISGKFWPDSIVTASWTDMKAGMKMKEIGAPVIDPAWPGAQHDKGKKK